ncbi:MAG: hypothetical protein D6721_08535 [Gammaproteobacteria bacterium]|nr:MAG: hypothetical protein D6721_08535 [Gammaproteobacteria bacterium]
MATEYVPRIGDWYRTATGEEFEIVAIDEDDQTIEIQYFDGTVEELDPESWLELDITPIDPPEDWSGSLDMEREDYGIDLESHSDPWHSPLDSLE